MTIRAPFSPVTISKGSTDPSLTSDLNQGVTSFSDDNAELGENRDPDTSTQPENNSYDNRTIRVSTPKTIILDPVQVKEEVSPRSPTTEPADPVYENLKSDQSSHDHNHNKEPVVPRSTRPSDSPRKTSQSHERTRRKQEVEKNSDQEVKNQHLADPNKVK
jgi:hypothetical protein